MEEKQAIEGLKKLYNELSGGQILTDKQAKEIMELARKAYNKCVPDLFK